MTQEKKNLKILCKILELPDEMIKQVDVLPFSDNQIREELNAMLTFLHAAGYTCNCHNCVEDGYEYNENDP